MGNGFGPYLIRIATIVLFVAILSVREEKWGRFSERPVAGSHIVQGPLAPSMPCITDRKASADPHRITLSKKNQFSGIQVI